MKQTTIIDIAIMFENLTVCSLDPEDHTHDDIPVDEKHRTLVTNVCESMCIMAELTPEQTQTIHPRLIQYVFENLACHDRDDDAVLINHMCDILAPYMPTKFECGMIDDGEFQGLYVLPLAECLLNSSWDFASFVMTLGLDELTDIHPDTMHPTREHARMIANVIDLADDERDTFINDFPLDWDT